MGIDVSIIRHYTKHMSKHRTHVYHTFEQFAASRVDLAEAKRTWKKHVEKHGSVPIIQECALCSGAEEKRLIKDGKWKAKRPSKRLRDDLKIEY